MELFSDYLKDNVRLYNQPDLPNTKQHKTRTLAWKVE
jgi:hypothetical protein